MASRHDPTLDLHLYDCGVFRTAHLFDYHDDAEILHHPGFRAVVWERHQHPAVVRDNPCLPR